MLVPENDKKIFVLLPAWNEQEVIRKVVEEILSYPYHIVVIDDGSEPPLAYFLHGLPVYYLRHQVNLGQGAALQTGISFACEQGADIIVSFDADGQHQADDIQLLLKALKNNGADLALGSRFLPGSSSNLTSGRKWLLHAARVVNFVFTGRLLSDAHNGLRAMNRSLAEKISLSQNGMAHATEIIEQAGKNGATIVEVPVRISYTEYSKAKGQTPAHGFRILFDLFLSKIFR